MLEVVDGYLQLRAENHPELNPIYVDFLAGKLAHRRLYGGGKNQLLVKAVGLHKKKDLVVLDISAGLAADSFILACLGAQVTALERNPTIAALVKDAIKRAQLEEWFRELKFEFFEIDAKEWLLKLSETTPDVIYFDPMFPERSKSALVKKEMRLLREIVGDDLDADELFKLALTKAKKRVVVKRPKLAPSLNNQKPSLVYHGKSSRFDVYLC